MTTKATKKPVAKKVATEFTAKSHPLLGEDLLEAGFVDHEGNQAKEEAPVEEAEAEKVEEVEE